MLRLARRNFVYTATTVRRSILEKVGLFDERFHNGEDYELWLRIASAGYRAAQAEGFLAVHREHQGSLTSRSAEAMAHAIDLHAAIVREHGDPDVRRLVSAQEAVLRHELQRVTAPTPKQHLEAAALAVRMRWSRRSLWLEQPPDEVARLLVSVAG